MQKIAINWLFIIILLSISSGLIAQTANKYGAIVILTESEYKRSVKKDPGKAMVDMRSIPGILLDLRYTTDSNFMQMRLYPKTSTTFMRRPGVEALNQIQQKLLKQGLTLVIWDAYRPYRVTELMWEKIRDTRYVADPAKGSGHNRGTAVDITIKNILTGQLLDMGTGYDNFSDTAHHSFKNLSNQVTANRNFLRALMTEHGFKAFDTEWWHYYLPNDKTYELLDIPFDELKKLQKKKHRLPEH